MTLLTTTYNPATHKLVPIEPTREMCAAVSKLDDEMLAGAYDGKGCTIEQAWNCLLDSAPAAPSGLLAPWADYRGYPIHDGDTIRHPVDGTEGRVIFVNEQWRVDYGDGATSALSLQICDKGQAVVVPKLPAPPAPKE